MQNNKNPNIQVMEISGDIQYDFLNQMVDANMDFEDVLISENETDSVESELQAIKFYLEGVAYTPIAIFGILGRFVDKNGLFQYPYFSPYD